MTIIEWRDAMYVKILYLSISSSTQMRTELGALIVQSFVVLYHRTCGSSSCKHNESGIVCRVDDRPGCVGALSYCEHYHCATR